MFFEGGGIISVCTKKEKQDKRKASLIADLKFKYADIFIILFFKMFEIVIRRSNLDGLKIIIILLHYHLDHIQN